MGTYDKFTPKTAWLLAAPHTWPASIFPVLLACSFAVACSFSISATMVFLLLAISVLMQSAVNSINDYFDFVKGTDSAEDNVDPTDAVLIYGNVDPRCARNLAIAFMAIAFLLGIYVIYVSGWIPLAIAVIGAIVVFLYSGGKTPISYLPIGEAVSGFVMGALICLASYFALTQELNWLVLIWSIPLVIGIGLIMLTNNTSDIEKDILAKRRTLPVLLDRDRSRRLYHVLVVSWIASIALIVGIWFTSGLLIIPFMLLACYPLFKAMIANPLLPETRIASMSQICSLNISLGAFYALSVMSSCIALSL